MLCVKTVGVEVKWNRAEGEWQGGREVAIPPTPHETRENTIYRTRYLYSYILHSHAAIRLPANYVNI